MHYIIYKTTNTVNGRYYIGAHKTVNLNDTYKGSDTALKAAIKEYGAKNFTREIIEICSSEEEMYLREAVLVTEETVLDRNTYNLSRGGRGGAGTPKSEEHKQKIKDNHLHKSNPGAGRKRKTDANVLAAMWTEYGCEKTAEMLGITLDACKSRYYRSK